MGELHGAGGLALLFVLVVCLGALDFGKVKSLPVVGPTIAKILDEVFGTSSTSVSAGGGHSHDGVNSRRLDFSGASPGTETYGSLMTTGSTWITFSMAGQCALKFLAANAATSGDFATLRLRGRADAAGSTEAGNFSASAGANDYGNLCAVYAAGQPNAYTQAGAANIVTGMHSVIDATAASSGRRWSTWIDDHSTTKASGSHYLCRLSQNGTIAIDGVFTIYGGGRCPVLFNIEETIGGDFYTATGSPGSTAAGYLAVKTPEGTKYIALLTA